MNAHKDKKTRTFVITVWPPCDLTKSDNLLGGAFSSELPPKNNGEKQSRKKVTPDVGVLTYKLLYL